MSGKQIRADVKAKIWDFSITCAPAISLSAPSEKKKTCRFCDFAAVCRYDRYRIDGRRDVDRRRLSIVAVAQLTVTVLS